VATPQHLLSRLEDIRQSRAVGPLNDAFERAVADFGGLGFAIGVVPKVDMPQVSQQRGLDHWIAYYHGSGLYRDCAFSRRVTVSAAPFTWDEEIEAEPEATYEVASAARGHGVRHGLYVPVKTSVGFHGGVFVQTEQSAHAADDRQALTLLALAAHLRLEEMEGPPLERVDRLSAREREVLLWFAEGKSAEDVAGILNIAAATVMYHYRGVAARYGTLNRTHTVVEAIRRGALQLD
jgi:DNA-binding CsgD family transcriptional regulator